MFGGVFVFIHRNARVALAVGIVAAGVSIASVIQSPADLPGAASLVLTTHASNERAIGATLRQLKRLAAVLDVPVLLRIGDFES